MSRLSTAQRVQVVSALVEGNSIRSTCRMMGVSKPTILKLLAGLGDVCLAYHDEHVRGLSCKRVQCDEIWSFVGAKQRNATDEMLAKGWGDVWTWTALDADTKLMVSYYVGLRGAWWAKKFMEDVALRVNSRIQITTDGHRVYADAVEGAFGMNVDYAMLIKLYGNAADPDSRYSPGEVIATEKVRIAGSPDPKHISTSFVERQNLTMRMSMRRFTRLTNGFSKKAENHRAAIAIHYLYYNFCRVHQTLRVTPAMEAGIADHVWSVEELVKLLDKRSILDGLTQVA